MKTKDHSRSSTCTGQTCRTAKAIREETHEYKLMFAVNGMIDINGNVDLSDFTADSIIKSVL